MKKAPPRLVPGRDDKYMGIAMWWAAFSKDPNTQVGAIIVSADNEPLGTGYNGPPRDISDHDFSWERPTKYDLIVHAEKNAIAHARGPTKGSTLYVTHKPCKRCMLDIVNARIAKVVYFPALVKDPKSTIAIAYDETDEIARLARINLLKFSGNLNWMRDRMKAMEELGVFG